MVCLNINKKNSHELLHITSDIKPLQFRNLHSKSMNDKPYNKRV